MSTSVAAKPPVRVATRLDWGASVCGDAQGFASRILKRTGAVRFVDSDEQLTVRSSIEPEGSGLDARVSLESKGRKDIVRHIASPDCDDALDALALVVAISIEARSREMSRPALPRRPPTRARRQPPERPPAAPPRASPTDPVGPSEAGGLPANAPPAPLLQPPLPVAESPPVGPAISPPPAPQHLTFASGVSAQIFVGVAPEALLGGQVWVRARWERGSVLSPELGLSVGHQRLDGFDDVGGQADFALNAASLDLCPLRLGSAALHVQPCAAGSLGRLQSKGHATFFPGGDTRPWASVGGNAQLVARFDIVEVRGSFGVSRPFVRDGFRFGPSCAPASCGADIFHQVEGAVWHATLGAGLNFR